MKKTLALVLALVMSIFAFAACTNKEENNSGQGKAETTYKIGICNFVDDASLNQIIENIESQLKTLGTENSVQFDVTVENCNMDASLLQQIIEEFKSDEVDLMVGVATPVAMAMQASVSDIPVVFAAVSDPLSAGLVESLEKPGSNITGTSDYLDTNAIFNLVTTLNPDIKKVGLLYDIGQDASTTPIADAKKYLDEHNIEYVEANGTTIEEIMIAAEQLVSEKVEAVFTPTDNSIMAAELSIYETFSKAGIPHYTGADSFALNGAFLGYGVDYANLGRVTADMVKEILVDGKNPAELSVRTFDNGTATVNTDICEALNLDFEEVKELFAPNCTEVKSIVTAEDFDD
ncbi:MAG: ABC transporter substrate-binding protein [Clostridia bacterium]|nr:ABC transporter substrate-binding protein [Clostridia bacterium]